MILFFSLLEPVAQTQVLMLCKTVLPWSSAAAQRPVAGSHGSEDRLTFLPCSEISLGPEGVRTSGSTRVDLSAVGRIKQNTLCSEFDSQTWILNSIAIIVTSFVVREKKFLNSQAAPSDTTH